MSSAESVKPIRCFEGRDGRLYADIEQYVTVTGRAFAELVARGAPTDEATIELILRGVFELTFEPGDDA